MGIPIIYEDDYLLVADKPSGVLTIPTPKKESCTLTDILNRQIKERGVAYRLHPCHRLDRETSGLIVYAKGKSAQRKMMDLFRQRKVAKRYIAFVRGIPQKLHGEIKTLIEGRPALTSYSVSKKFKDFSVIQVEPLTGRTNQIRIHFKQMGHPLLGESVFAFRRDFPVRAKRLCLHASELEFVHPVAGGRIHLRIGLAQDLKKFLDTHV